MPIAVESYKGVLVSVLVPPGAQGELALTHRLPGWPWTPLAALVGVLVVVVYGRYARAGTRRIGMHRIAPAIGKPA
jgi:hypothetical protein